MKKAEIICVNRCIALLGVLLFSFSSNAQIRTEELPSIPWHTINIFWTFKNPNINMDRLDMDVTVDRDVPTSYSLYISPFNSTFNNIQFYAGIQTNVINTNVADSTHIATGKGGIFSRWSTRPDDLIGLDYTDMQPDGFRESASTEGNFCSVRRPFIWTKGTYTLSLVKNETIDFKNQPHTWVSYEITDKSNNKTHTIGRLLFEGDSLILNHQLVAFVEIYGGEKSEKSIPEVNITFGSPVINNQDTPLGQVYAKQILGTKIPATPNITYITSEKDNITVHLSPEIKEQSKNEIIQVIFLEKNKTQ
jgi:hypothetical protein